MHPKVQIFIYDHNKDRKNWHFPKATKRLQDIDSKPDVEEYSAIFGPITSILRENPKPSVDRITSMTGPAKRWAAWNDPLKPNPSFMALPFIGMQASKMGH